MLVTDLKSYYPTNITETGNHGGRVTANLITSGADNNTFDDVTSEERASGLIRYNKVFRKVIDTGNGTLKNGKLYMVAPLISDDTWATFFPGTETDILSDYTGWDTGADSEDKYGAAYIDSAITAGTRTIVFTAKSSKLLPSGADGWLRVGDQIRLAKTGVAKFYTIDSLSESGLQVTVVTTADITVDFPAGSVLSSVVLLGDIKTSAAAVSYTGGANYDLDSYAPTLSNKGTVRQRLTFAFTDSTNFTCTGDSMGNLGTGNVNTDFSVTNTAFGALLFTLLSDGWTGLTISSGDTFVMDIFGTEIGVYQKNETVTGADIEDVDLQLALFGEPSA